MKGVIAVVSFLCIMGGIFIGLVLVGQSAGVKPMKIASGDIGCSPPVFGSISCSFHSLASVPEKACWEVVLECRQSHRVHFCTYTVLPGSVESVAANVTYPPLQEWEFCRSERIENVEIR